LLSDFLATRAVGSNIAAWTAETFDILTFNGASFDPLVLLLGTVADGHRDALLRAVHDWNFYASAYLLVEAKGGGFAIAPAMESLRAQRMPLPYFVRIRRGPRGG
jgi:hypothetical protein